MKLLVSLTLLLVAALLADRFAQQWGAERAAHMHTLLNLGVLMLGAWLTGELFDRLNLPRISGYLIFGVVLGPAALGLVAKDHMPKLAFANDLAVSLIALTAGSEIRLDWLRSRVGQLLGIISVDVILILAGGVGVFMLAKPLIPFLADESWLTAFCVGLLAATVMIANSPTVVIAMVSEYHAEGPLTQMTLGFTVLKDLVLIILFATVTSIVKALLDENAAMDSGFLVALAVQLLGTIGLGAALGLLMAGYVQFVGAHLIYFILGACMVFALIGEQHFPVMGYDVHFEPLLMALAAGMLCQNVWPSRSEPMFHTIESMSTPIYCLFFALAGAKVDLGAFAAMWYLVIGLSLIRAGLIWAGVTGGAKVAGIQGDWTNRLWLGMIPQAGVTLVLITLIGKSFEADFGWGRELASVLIGMIAIHELLGPIGFRHALLSTGEARQTTARQPAPSH